MKQYTAEDMKTDVDFLVGNGMDESEAKEFIVNLLNSECNRDVLESMPDTFFDEAENESNLTKTDYEVIIDQSSIHYVVSASSKAEAEVESLKIFQKDYPHVHDGEYWVGEVLEDN